MEKVGKEGPEGLEPRVLVTSRIISPRLRTSLETKARVKYRVSVRGVVVRRAQSLRSVDWCRGEGVPRVKSVTVVGEDGPDVHLRMNRRDEGETQSLCSTQESLFNTQVSLAKSVPSLMK